MSDIRNTVQGVERPFWPSLDGIRALAVMAVVGFHLDLPGFGAGFGGVDVFFCLSGFLITSLLIYERRTTGRVSLSSFWIRRILRLYPALLVTCTAVSLLAVVAGRRVADQLEAAIGSVFYVANWLYATGHRMVLLDHTWTLALEEQFYLFLPVLLVLVWSKRTLPRLGAAALVVGLIVALVALRTSVPPVYHSYMRAAPMIMGIALAVLLSKRRRSPRSSSRPLMLLGLLALAALVAALVLPVGLPAPAMGGPLSAFGWLTAVVIAMVVVQPAGPAAALLSTTALRWVGRRSYGLYLYHFPIVSISLHQLPASISYPVRCVIAVAASLVATEVSYRFIEVPCLRLRDRFEPRRRRLRGDRALDASAAV